MKINYAIYPIFLIGILLTFVLSCKKENPKVAPSITVAAVTNITATSATSGGDITSDGGADITAHGVCWSTHENPTLADNKVNNGAGSGSFSSSVTGLIQGTTYYIRAYAINTVGTKYSSQLSFITLALAPVLTTNALSAVTLTSVSCGGNITNDGGTPVKARGVCWSTYQNPTIADSITINGLGSGSFTSSITRLTPGMTYYFRAYAINNIGVGYGNQVTVTTNNEYLDISSTAKYIMVNGVGASQAAFQEIVDVFGKSKDKKIIVGAGFIISVLNMTPANAAIQLRQYLSLSEQNEVPVIIQLDGEQWWGNRPDLWNWWDDTKAGYNPDNRKNVEWTSWTSDSSVKIGWRNWGRQLRVLPMPNLMSPTYRAACDVEMGKMATIIMDWWKLLPLEKKYLLVGIKVGWESSIGVNTWYYPNGNDLLALPEANDPTSGINVSILPSRGVQSIGYAAVSTLGLATSGTLKEEQLTEVVRVHLEDLCKNMSSCGVPRDRLFTHSGGWKVGETLSTAAVNKYSCPGWSFYTYSSDPKKDITIMNSLKASDAPYWGAVEWLYQGQHTKDQWKSALTNTLSDSKFKYMCIYNWANIKNNSNCITAIQEVLQ